MELNFGKRKVQFVRGTAFVSLPRSWIRTQSIRKGDWVCIRLMDNDNLVVSAVSNSTMR